MADQTDFWASCFAFSNHDWNLNSGAEINGYIALRLVLEVLQPWEIRTNMFFHTVSEWFYPLVEILISSLGFL